MFPEVEEKVALLTPQSETAPSPPPPSPPYPRPHLPQHTQSWPWQSHWRISPWAHQFAHPSFILFAIFCCHLSAAPSLSPVNLPPSPQATRATVPAALLYCIWWLAKVSCLYSFIVYKCLISAAPSPHSSRPLCPFSLSACWTAPELQRESTRHSIETLRRSHDAQVLVKQLWAPSDSAINKSINSRINIEKDWESQLTL